MRMGSERKEESEREREGKRVCETMKNYNTSERRKKKLNNS